jgi:hypothetical protein
MTDTLEQQIAALEAAIARKEAALLELEAELLDLRRDLSDFEARYRKLIGPLEIRLEAALAAVRDLEDERGYGANKSKLGDDNPLPSFWQPLADYVPVAEQFRRAWHVPPPVEPPPDSPATAIPKPRAEAPDSREAQVKKLYRTLALRYHPDLTTDLTERERRNDLMARINEAYTQRDLGALQALADRPAGRPPEEPLDLLRLRDLQRIDDQLADRLADLRLEHTNLLHGDLTKLALEEKFARRQGRDLLRDMAADLERQYQAAMLKLERLRRR